MIGWTLKRSLLRRKSPPIGKGTGSTGDPHFALGTAVESPKSAVWRARTCNEWPDDESSSRNAKESERVVDRRPRAATAHAVIDIGLLVVVHTFDEQDSLSKSIARQEGILSELPYC